MKITATIENRQKVNQVSVSTDGIHKTITIPSKENGLGSAVNGGELLFLALATCFCNDVYREGAKRKMNIDSVSVSVKGEFGREGEPGRNIEYIADVKAPGHSEQEISDLLAYVDSVAEVQNTLRQGLKLKLSY